LSKKLIIIIAGVAFLLLWAGALVGLNQARLNRNIAKSGSGASTGKTSNNPTGGGSGNQTGSSASQVNSIAPTNSAPGGSFGPSDGHKAKLPTAG